MRRSKRWQEVKEILYPALEMAGPERSSFLDEKCGDDVELRSEIESLIDAHIGAAERFESPAVEKMAGVVSNEQADGIVGRSLGHYEVIEKLGAGGMGEVYLARDTLLNRKVALKFLPLYFTQDKERVRRFQQEARAVSALNHPNILTIYEIRQVDSLDYIATEFIEGKTLRAFLDSGPLQVTEALETAIQVAGALSAAHGAGIVHRDIKPENIMLRRDGIVKVLDFGLAKLTEKPANPYRTSARHQRCGDLTWNRLSRALFLNSPLWFRRTGVIWPTSQTSQDSLRSMFGPMRVRTKAAGRYRRPAAHRPPGPGPVANCSSSIGEAHGRVRSDLGCDIPRRASRKGVGPRLRRTL